MPYLPLTLTWQQAFISVMGLVDSGATVNVLPYDVGLQLGADWDKQTTPLQLGGNLGSAAARALLVTGKVGAFPPVRLAFAWSRSNAVPVILGQLNFFAEFDVYLSRSLGVFEVKPR
jgi:hypothetical protein